MKIARLIETFLPNITGPVNQAFKLSQKLEEKNIHSPVITSFYNVSNAPNEEFISLVHVTRLNFFRIMQYCISPALLKTMEKCNKKQKIDIIHSHTYRSYQTEIGYKFAKKNNIPFVLSTHGSLLGYDHYLKNDILKIPYRMYDLLKNKKPYSALKMIAKMGYQSGTYCRNFK